VEETLTHGRNDDTAPIPVVGDTPARGRHAAPPARHGASAWVLRIAREGGIILGLALLASVLVRLVIAQPIYVAGTGMGPTLDAGDRALVGRVVLAVMAPARGDVIAFEDPGGWQELALPNDSAVYRVLGVLGLAPVPNTDVIMRVAAVGGDRISCCDPSGRIVVNGRALDEPYLPQAMPTDQVTFDVVVPPDSYFVLGDDRAAAQDSRYHLGKDSGAISRADLRGIIIMRLWPPQVLATPAAYDDIPDIQASP